MEEKTDRRIRRTKHLLLQALTKLMQEKSIKDITVKELCEISDINRGTFYLHYKDIYDMLEKVENDLLAQLENVFKKYTPYSTPDFPYPLFLDTFRIIEENTDLCHALLSPNGDISFMNKTKELFRHQYLHEYIVEHTPAGFPTSHEYFSDFLVAGCSGLIEAWLSHGKVESPEEMAALISQLISSGMTSICPPDKL